MAVTLLDVNVLVALAWPNHLHHGFARDWFLEHADRGWATTPVTELGFVRVSSNKAVLPVTVTPGAALGVLEALCDRGNHRFWPDDCRLLAAPFPLNRLGTHRQVTDVHLVTVAARNNGRLGTFDRGITRAVDDEYRDVIELLPTG